MATDYRALCAELAEGFAYYLDRHHEINHDRDQELVARARAALAAEPQGLRAVLARWGAVDCPQPPPDHA